MTRWCKDCVRYQDGYLHLKCQNCKWYTDGGDDFKWDRFILANKNARHPSSYEVKTKKKSGLAHKIFKFVKTELLDD